MKTLSELQDLVTDRLSRAWRSFGLPIPVEPLDERTVGLVDPEALIVLTLLHVQDSRLLADVFVWVSVNRNLLLLQKLTTLRDDRTPIFPGLFVSCETVKSLPALVDAVRATDPSLRKAMMPSCDSAWDGLGAELTKDAK